MKIDYRAHAQANLYYLERLSIRHGGLLDLAKARDTVSEMKHWLDKAIEEKEKEDAEKEHTTSD